MSLYVETWNFKARTFILLFLAKKDPTEDKELPGPSGPFSMVIPSSSIDSCNTEVTKVLKQA